MVLVLEVRSVEAGPGWAWRGKSADCGGCFSLPRYDPTDDSTLHSQLSQ